MFCLNVGNIRTILQNTKHVFNGDCNVVSNGNTSKSNKIVPPKVWPSYSTVPQILATACGHGLNVFCLSETPGDGNCFYHAIIEQLCDRTDLGDVSELKLQYPNHLRLRHAVVEFVRNQSQLDEHDCPYIAGYKNFF